MTYKNLFESGKVFHANACLDPHYTPLDKYARGYRQAGDILIKESLKGEATIDISIYPIVFNYRQFIELMLKSIIQDARKLLLQNVGFPKTHQLTSLWQTARPLIAKIFGEETPDKNLKFVSHVISEFARVDDASFSFRYPTTKDGYSTIPDITNINILDLQKSFSKIADALEGISMGLSSSLENIEESV